MEKTFHSRAVEVHQRIQELLSKEEGSLSFEECSEICYFFDEKIFEVELSAVCRTLNIDQTSMLYDHEEWRIRPRAKKFLEQLEFSYLIS